jgi:hypothetical protein
MRLDASPNVSIPLTQIVMSAIAKTNLLSAGFAQSLNC